MAAIPRPTGVAACAGGRRAPPGGPAATAAPLPRPRLVGRRPIAVARASSSSSAGDASAMASRIEQLTRENEALRAELNALRAESGLPPAAAAAVAQAQATAVAAAAQAQAQGRAAATAAQAQAAAAATAAASAAAAAAAGAAAAGAGAATKPAAAALPPPPQQPSSASAAAATMADPAALEQTLAQGVNWPSAAAGEAWRTSGSNMPSPDAFFWASPARVAPAPADVTAAIAADAPAAAAPPPHDPRPPLHVVHLAAELAPHAKVGGLGDVVTGLARACAARGHRVQVCLPFYEFLQAPEQQGGNGDSNGGGDGGGVVENLKHEGDVDVPKGRVFDGRTQLEPLPTSVYSGTIAGVDVLLIRPADRARSALFRGARIYAGGYNETEAYLYFCRAALEWLARSPGAKPDVIHLHDWQTTAAAMLFWEVYHASAGGPLPQRSSVVFTIHNLASGGETRADEFGAFLGLDFEVASRFAHVDRALDERTIGHNPERLSLLKGGIVYGAAVTTVSPTYAREILTGGESGWLRPTFARPDVAKKFRGVLNGIDCAEWSPETDPFLPANYSARACAAGKRVCKAFLQRGLGLDVDPDAPLVVAITRLVPQKGIPLIAAAVRRAIELGGQAVVLGTGHADGDFRRMADGELRGSGRGRVVLLHSEALAHQLYAAADVVLVPSHFEPCGLTQMIAARYGAVPLVRRTGGLADTVADVDEAGGGGGGGAQAGGGGGACAGGYVFDAPNDDAVRGALDRCLRLYREGPAEWEALRRRNMTADFSWSGSAGEYLDVYYGLVG